MSDRDAGALHPGQRPHPSGAAAPPTPGRRSPHVGAAEPKRPDPHGEGAGVEARPAPPRQPVPAREARHQHQKVLRGIGPPTALPLTLAPARADTGRGGPPMASRASLVALIAGLLLAPNHDAAARKFQMSGI